MNECVQVKDKEFKKTKIEKTNLFARKAINREFQLRKYCKDLIKSMSSLRGCKYSYYSQVCSK